MDRQTERQTGRCIEKDVDQWLCLCMNTCVYMSIHINKASLNPAMYQYLFLFMCIQVSICVNVCTCIWVPAMFKRRHRISWSGELSTMGVRNCSWVLCKSCNCTQPPLPSFSPTLQWSVRGLRQLKYFQYTSISHQKCLNFCLFEKSFLKLDCVF